MGHKENCECGGVGVCRIIVGGLLGAGLALLLAPQSGKKTRKYLSCFAKEWGGKANEAVSDFAETLSDFVENASDRASELMREKGELTQESKKALLRALEKGQQILEKQRKKLEEMID